MANMAGRGRASKDGVGAAQQAPGRSSLAQRNAAAMQLARERSEASSTSGSTGSSRRSASAPPKPTGLRSSRRTQGLQPSPATTPQPALRKKVQPPKRVSTPATPAAAIPAEAKAGTSSGGQGPNPEPAPLATEGPRALSLDYRAISPDYSPPAAVPVAPKPPQRVGDWALVTDYSAYISANVIQQAMGYVTKPWMWLAILGPRIEVRSLYGRSSWLLSPTMPTPHAAPTEPETTPYDTAMAFLHQRHNLWMPSPLFYKLPLVYEHAWLLWRMLNGPIGPYNSEICNMRNDCISWLQDKSGPADNLPAKYVPSADHPAHVTWLHFRTRKSPSLPGVAAQHPVAIPRSEVAKALVDHPTPPTLVAGFTRAPAGRPAAHQAVRPKPAFSKMGGLGSTRTGSRSVVVQGVTNEPGCVMEPRSSKAAKGVLEKIAGGVGSPGYPVVAFVAEQNSYTVTSQFVPMVEPGLNAVVAQCQLTLSNTIDPALPHENPVVQWSTAPREKCCDAAALSAVSVGGAVSGRKVEEALSHTLVCEQAVRLQNLSHLLDFKTTRKSLTGLFCIMGMLAFQLSRALRAQVVLEMVGVVQNVVHIVTQPSTAAGVAQLQEQTLNEELLLLCPEDILTSADLCIATLVSVGGVALQAPAGQDVSVVDTLVWPAFPVTVLASAPTATVPNFVAALPTPQQVLALARRIALTHSAEDAFNAGIMEAAALAGANWKLTPDAPMANINLPYQHPQAGEPFDNLLELDEDDARLVREEAPWPEHPQADLGIRYYTQQGVPVLMRAVAVWPTMETVSAVSVPEPGGISALQLLLKMIPAPAPGLGISLQLIPNLAQWDSVLLLVSAAVAAMASTLLRSHNLVGSDISALILDSPDLTRTLMQLGAGNEFAPNQHSAYPASGFFLRLRALIERTVGVSIPPGTWATRVWNGRHAGDPNAVTALCARFNHPDEVPNFGNVLGIDGMLLLRPIEWGLSAGLVTADFTMELAADNALGVSGFFTHLGTAEYEKRLKEKHDAPWQWLTHSATSLQTCCRWLAALIGNRNDITIHEAHNSLAGPGGFVNVAVRVHIENAPFIAGTGYLPPLMIRTFTHRDMSVCMPALQDAALLPVMAHFLRARSGPQPTYVPLARAPAEHHRQRFGDNVPVANYRGRDNYGNAQTGHVSRKEQHVAMAATSKKSANAAGMRQRSRSKGSGRSASGGSRGSKSPRKKKQRTQRQARSRSNSKGSQSGRKGSSSPSRRSASREGRSRSKSPGGNRKQRPPTPGPKARGKSKSPGRRSNSRSPRRSN